MNVFRKVTLSFWKANLKLELKNNNYIYNIVDVWPFSKGQEAPED